ncbi:MAG: SDR family NAD(P)-dependent oxidoreductase, partial [Chloroflexota bacterium]|nr:SDR family NAD(P)-dependent oxidoreductase [Chloroflexota bacterium]
FAGKVAVVTGAASGIGRALTNRWAGEGMKVVLADVEQTALDRVVEELRSQGREVTGVLTDVSKAESVEALAHRAFDTYGKVHVLCNNAGVMGGRPGSIWEATLKDWQWVLGVNVWGVIHGIHTFVPRMLQQDEEGWVVNTASMGGLIPGNGAYGVSKHAVVAISEALYSHLKIQETKLGCSVLCPIFIKTQLLRASRNRPPELVDTDLPAVPPGTGSRFASRIENGQEPSEIADAVFDGIRNEQFYIWPGDDVDQVVRTRFDHILARTNPDPRPFG